jgi:hypothetical protein
VFSALRRLVVSVRFKGEPSRETESLFLKGGFGFALGFSGLVHSDFLLFLTVAQIVIDFSFQIKGKNDLSQEFYKGTWHGSCFGIVLGSGLPKTKNYKKTPLY